MKTRSMPRKMPRTKKLKPATGTINPACRQQGDQRGRRRPASRPPAAASPRKRGRCAVRRRLTRAAPSIRVRMVAAAERIEDRDDTRRDMENAQQASATATASSPSREGRDASSCGNAHDHRDADDHHRLMQRHAHHAAQRDDTSDRSRRHREHDPSPPGARDLETIGERVGPGGRRGWPAHRAGHGVLLQSGMDNVRIHRADWHCRGLNEDSPCVTRTRQGDERTEEEGGPPRLRHHRIAAASVRRPATPLTARSLHGGALSHQIDSLLRRLAFPGGKLEEADGAPPALVRMGLVLTDRRCRAQVPQVAGVREAFEECGVLLARKRSRQRP